MKRKIALCLLFIQCFIAGTLAQSTITGKVVETENGWPLPGVSVIVKDTNQGAVTDFDGNFSIEVANTQQVLVFSYVGFETKQVKIGDQSNLNIKLDPNLESLEEVVVTGYGLLKAADVPSAQSSISSEDIDRTVNSTIEQAIVGRAPGVNVTQNTGAPGGGISVSIRGISSINGSNEPLYVIDGVQLEGSYSVQGTNPLSTLNPSDIESMEILRGPSATAIYGSRGTNGVVVITTKRGKAGDVRINYSYLYSLQTPPEHMDVMNLREYAQMDIAYKAAAGGNNREEFLDPSILGEGTNWQDELFRTAPMTKHQVSLSGGSDKTTYYLSGESLNQEGVALGSGFERTSVRLNLDNKAADWLSIAANVSYAETDQQLPTVTSDLIGTALRMQPAVPVRNLDGTFGGGQARINADGSTSEAERFSPPNPIGMASILTNERMQRQLLGGLNATFNLAEGLEFRTAFNANYGFNSGTSFTPTYEWGFQVNSVSELWTNSQTSTYWNWNQMLQYSRDFGKHSLTVMATHESQESTYKNISGTRQNYPTNDILDLNAGGVDNQTNSGGQSEWGMESYLARINYNFDDRYIFQGAFRADGSANFGAENRWGYFPSVSAAWRVSNESFFDISAVSDLRIRVETGLTGSQGNSGNIFARLNIYPTEWGNGYLPANYPNTNFKWEETRTNNIGFNLGLFNNRVQIEGDYYIKNTDNLIVTSSLPWYMGTAPDATASIDAPVVNIGALQNKGWGINLSTVNINNGDFVWETNLNVSHYKATITALYTENSVISRLPPSWHIGPQWTQRSEVGEEPWYFYGYVADGLFDTMEELENSPRPADNDGNPMPIGENNIWLGDVKYKDLNGDGVIDDKDQTNIGSPWPEFFGGFSNSFSYKGFDLSVLLTGTFGSDVYNYLRFQNTNPGNINIGRNLFDEAMDYAQIGEDESGNPIVTNPGTNVPRIDGNTGTNGNFDRHSTKFVEDGSFVRVKNISLSYTLPSSFHNDQNIIQGARIGLSAQNVYTFTDYTGYDPEVGSYVGPEANSGNAPIGVDTGRYPLTPMYSFNLSIDF
jgi:TonB-linked SusC/RagA family outer membrane protein